MAAPIRFSRCFYLKCAFKTCKRRHNSQLTIHTYVRHSSIQDSEKVKGGKQYDTFYYNVPTRPGEKKDTSVELPSKYSPQYVEAAWYDWWMEQGFFQPKGSSADGTEKFVICLPPPNVTGTLHLGHALTCAIQDVLVRWHRMQGHETLWIPGCDHAGIATQVVVEKQLMLEGLTRHDVGREAFLEKVWQWKHSKGNTIYDQMKKLGSSLDWSRACFTMDQSMSVAVREAFIRLHNEGLIYQSSRLVHWCCHLRSTISDIEVVNVQVESPTPLKIPGYEKPVMFGEIHTFAYPVVDSDDEVLVSTTRLETMLGDTGMAVHPDDPRYTHLHGKHVRHPIDGRHIPIVTDSSVEIEFGTGAVKITPAHDHTDFAIGARHGLQTINIINDCGLMENVAERYLGQPRFEARQGVREELMTLGLYRGVKPNAMVIPTCQRSGDVIEPRIKMQWYLRCDAMAAHALQAVESGELTLIPDHYRKIWHEFLTNEKTRDWCISRQIWWGHRIPAYKVVPQKHMEVGADALWVSAHSHEEACIKAQEKLGLSAEEFNLEQDEDVLDTWFSSALFPFSSLGWPQQTSDLGRYYPTSLLETGSDILFFWVARMIMLGYKMTGQLPFNKVLLHGTLRDAQGRKMSKSLGNVIDPMDVIHGSSLEALHEQVEQNKFGARETEAAKAGQRKDFPHGIPECGADALRFALCSYQFRDDEMRMNITDVEAYRHFCNKIWQSYRWVQHNLGADFRPTIDLESQNSATNLSSVDRWILSSLSRMVHQCDSYFTNYELHYATHVLYNFWWNHFCAVYLEYAKKALTGNNSETVKNVLHFCTSTFVRALSPFMPYISEELYQRLPSAATTRAESVCVAEYPRPDKYPWYDTSVEADMELVLAVCSGTHATAKLLQLSPKTLQVYVHMLAREEGRLDGYKQVFSSQLRAQSTSVQYGRDPPHGCLKKSICQGVNVYIKVEDKEKVTSLLNKLRKSRGDTEEKISALAKKKQKPDVISKKNKLHNKITEIDEQIRTLETLASG